MIAIDANLLLYAYNAAAPEHVRARAWLEATFSAPSLVGLPLVSVLAFLRIATDRRLSDAAHAPAQAAEIVDSWLKRDNVSILEPGARHWPIFFATLSDVGATGPRVSDVHLAALAIEHGATFYTNDRDFRVFPELDVRFPLRAGGAT
jgi:toxin-antitoxin system PIN domain toxin